MGSNPQPFDYMPDVVPVPFEAHSVCGILHEHKVLVISYFAYWN